MSKRNKDALRLDEPSAKRPARDELEALARALLALPRGWFLFVDLKEKGLAEALVSAWRGEPECPSVSPSVVGILFNMVITDPDDDQPESLQMAASVKRLFGLAARGCAEDYWCDVYKAVAHLETDLIRQLPARPRIRYFVLSMAVAFLELHHCLLPAASFCPYGDWSEAHQLFGPVADARKLRPTSRNAASNRPRFVERAAAAMLKVLNPGPEAAAASLYVLRVAERAFGAPDGLLDASGLPPVNAESAEAAASASVLAFEAYLCSNLPKTGKLLAPPDGTGLADVFRAPAEALTLLTSFWPVVDSWANLHEAPQRFFKFLADDPEASRCADGAATRPEPAAWLSRVGELGDFLLRWQWLTVDRLGVMFFQPLPKQDFDAAAVLTHLSLEFVCTTLRRGRWHMGPRRLAALWDFLRARGCFSGDPPAEAEGIQWPSLDEFFLSGHTPDVRSLCEALKDVLLCPAPPPLGLQPRHLVHLACGEFAPGQGLALLDQIHRNGDRREPFDWVALSQDLEPGCFDQLLLAVLDRPAMFSGFDERFRRELDFSSLFAAEADTRVVFALMRTHAGFRTHGRLGFAKCSAYWDTPELLAAFFAVDFLRAGISIEVHDSRRARRDTANQIAWLVNVACARKSWLSDLKDTLRRVYREDEVRDALVDRLDPGCPRLEDHLQGVTARAADSARVLCALWFQHDFGLVREACTVKELKAIFGLKMYGSKFGTGKSLRLQVGIEEEAREKQRRGLADLRAGLDHLAAPEGDLAGLVLGYAGGAPAAGLGTTGSFATAIAVTTAYAPYARAEAARKAAAAAEMV